MARRSKLSDEGIEFAIPEVKEERMKNKRRWFDIFKKKKQEPVTGAFTESPEYRNPSPRAVPVIPKADQP